MKFISQDIKDIKEAIVRAVMNDKNVKTLKDNLEILQSIEGLKNTIIDTTINHFEGKLPTEDELNTYVNGLVDGTSSDVVEPYRDDIVRKAQCEIAFQVPMESLKRGDCFYG